VQRRRERLLQDLVPKVPKPRTTVHTLRRLVVGGGFDQQGAYAATLGLARPR